MDSFSSSQAWSILQQHADKDVQKLRLTDLCQQEERVNSMVAVHNSTVDHEEGYEDYSNRSGGGGHLLLVDFSRQRMSLETINLLFRFAATKQLKNRILDLAWGRLAPGSKLVQERKPEKQEFNTPDGLPSSPTVSFAHDIDGRKYSSMKKCRNGGMYGAQGMEEFDDDEDGDKGGSMHLSFRAPAKKGLVMLNPYMEKHPNQRNNYNDSGRQKRTCRSNSSNNRSRMNTDQHSNGSDFNSNRDKHQIKMKESDNALNEIHQEWKRIQSLTDSLRQGKLRGATGLPLCDVLIVSMGGTVVPAALKFVYHALLQDEDAEKAALINSSLVSLPPSAVVGGFGGVGVMNGSGSSTGAGIGCVGPTKTVESMASTVAGGVINMVTTPFKSARNKSTQDLHDSGLGSSGPSFEFPFASSHTNSTPSSFPRRRKLKFISSIDSSSFKEAVCDLCPATTMVITLAVDVEKEKECKKATVLTRSWLLSGMTGNISSSNGGGGSSSAGHRDTRSDAIVKMHMFLVTGKDSLKKSNPNNIFLIPRHSRCEAFGALSAAGLLPLSLLFGWKVVSSLLSGAHDLDRHFVDTNPRHNLPVILALTDLWNDAFLQSEGRVVSPFSQAYGSFPVFVAALEDKVLNGIDKARFFACGRNRSSIRRGAVSTDIEIRRTSTPVIDGGSHAVHDRLMFQGKHLFHSELISVLDTRLTSFYGAKGRCGVGNGCTSRVRNLEDLILANHNERVCSMFAHADTLAFGDGGVPSSNKFASPYSAVNSQTSMDSPDSPPMIQSVDSMQSYGSVNSVIRSPYSVRGNRPSTLLICGVCDAFSIGQLISLVEHRTLVKAWLWDVDPFAVPKSPSVHKDRTDFLVDQLGNMYSLLAAGEDLDEIEDTSSIKRDNIGCGVNNLSLATHSILKHYAKRMQKYNQAALETPVKSGPRVPVDDNS